MPGGVGGQSWFQHLCGSPQAKTLRPSLPTRLTGIFLIQDLFSYKDIHYLFNLRNFNYLLNIYKQLLYHFMCLNYLAVMVNAVKHMEFACTR
jgi:hypothetical protein